MEWLNGWLNDALQWFYDFMLWLPRKLWKLFLDGLHELVDAIEPPAFFAQAAQYASSVPPEVLWAFDLFAVSTGLGMVLTALVLRFLIRRLPIIG